MVDDRLILDPQERMKSILKEANPQKINSSIPINRLVLFIVFLFFLFMSCFFIFVFSFFFIYFTFESIYYFYCFSKKFFKNLFKFRAFIQIYFSSLYDLLNLLINCVLRTYLSDSQ